MHASSLHRREMAEFILEEEDGRCGGMVTQTEVLLGLLSTVIEVREAC